MPDRGKEATTGAIRAEVLPREGPEGAFPPPARRFRTETPKGQPTAGDVLDDAALEVLLGTGAIRTSSLTG